MEYPADVCRDDNGTWLVTFPDIEGATYGETIEEALARASDALATILEAYIRDGQPIPRPSPPRTQYAVTVPAAVAAKVSRYLAERRE